MTSEKKKRAPRNRTLTLSDEERARLQKQLCRPVAPVSKEACRNCIFTGDFFSLVDLMPDHFVDLMIIDPPYNLNKNFNETSFRHLSNEAYEEFLDSIVSKLMRLLKPQATVYICGDWQCSGAMFNVMSRYLILRNRICWQREKGRGAQHNWKNCCEDIWFGTVGKEYCFNGESVRMKRQVIAPYRESTGPKDWVESEEGRFRMTGAANFWDDISVPYWSMPENTDHPTQKPEKLLAKLILASSNEGDMIFDPFLGSGSTAVTAKKLKRSYCGIELDPEYCCWALARLERAENDPRIQGYEDGVFWERNTLALREKMARKRKLVPTPESK